jgi:hypothetical protein
MEDVMFKYLSICTGLLALVGGSVNAQQAATSPQNTEVPSAVSALKDDDVRPGGLLAASSLAAVAHAKELRCDNANIMVHSKEQRDVALGCEGADRAIRFLSALGLATNGAVVLRIVNHFPKAADSSVLGYYSRRDRCAYLLSFAEIGNRGAPFGLSLDYALYRSMATHEVAHIIIARNFSVPEPQLKAKEYLAYVTMFATMPAYFRRRILEKIPYEAFETENDISAMLFLFDPIQFGVRAYKHYTKLQDKPAFVRGILAGKALATELLYPAFVRGILANKTLATELLY